MRDPEMKDGASVERVKAGARFWAMRLAEPQGLVCEVVLMDG